MFSFSTHTMTITTGRTTGIAIGSATRAASASHSRLAIEHAQPGSLGELRFSGLRFSGLRFSGLRFSGICGESFRYGWSASIAKALVTKKDNTHRGDPG